MKEYANKVRNSIQDLGRKTNNKEGKVSKMDEKTHKQKTAIWMKKEHDGRKIE